MQRALSWLMFVLLLLSGVPVFADCWEIQPRGADPFKASEIWQLKNTISGAQMLLGRIDGTEVAIAPDEVESFTFLEEDGGWLSVLSSGASRAQLQFRDGRRAVFQSNLVLFAQGETGQREFPLNSLIAIRRCEEPQAPAAAAPSEGAGPASAPQDGAAVQRDVHRPEVDVIYLDNGDVISGTILNREFLWSATFATVRVERRDVARMTLQREDTVFGLIELRNGDKYTGILETTPLEIELTIGAKITVESKNIKAVRFGKAAPAKSR